MSGVGSDGYLLLVTADGRAPGYSVGLSFPEEAAVMNGFGARDALNLDGGGSTTMVADVTLLTRPSDSTGERPIGDAILLLPATTPRSLTPHGVSGRGTSNTAVTRTAEGEPQR